MKKLTIASFLSALMTAPLAAPVCGPQADSVAFVMDASGSMMQTFEQAKEKAGLEPDSEIDKVRISQAVKTLMDTAARAVGDNEMALGLYTLAPYAKLVELVSQKGVSFQEAVERKFNPELEVFGRPTWMGKRAKSDLATVLKDKQTVIFITDGGFTPDINDAVEVFNSYRKVNPELQFYVISAAYGQEKVAQIKAFNSQTHQPVHDLQTLVNDSALLDQFIRSVIYNDCGDRIELRDVNFAFDSDKLDSKSQSILNAALEAIRTKSPEVTMTIEGWTDSIGTDAYNAGLSLRRAKSVADFLVKAGIDEKRLTVKGMGVSVKYNNRTPEGRYDNRRVEIVFNDVSIK